MVTPGLPPVTNRIVINKVALGPLHLCIRYLHVVSISQPAPQARINKAQDVPAVVVDVLLEPQHDVAGVQTSPDDRVEVERLQVPEVYSIPEETSQEPHSHCQVQEVIQAESMIIVEVMVSGSYTPLNVLA